MPIRRPPLLLLALFSLLSRGAAADAPSGRYTFPGDGTVYDTRSKLAWQQTTSPTAGLVAAAYYCSGLPGVGWRLPTIKELYTLVDTSKLAQGLKIDLTAFPDTQPGYYWSATPSNHLSGYEWTLYFASAETEEIYYPSTVSTGPSRCVRSQ